MRVLALCSYPVQAASTRYRLTQLQGPLVDLGIELEIRPFLRSAAFRELYVRSAWPRTVRRLIAAAFRRLPDVWRSTRADVLLVQREAMNYGPPVVEWLATGLRHVPMVLDLDDATYVPYESTTYGRLGFVRKWPGKVDWLIRRAEVVACGNEAILDHVRSVGSSGCLVPTVVDTGRFVPGRTDRRGGSLPVLGWIGSPSTYPYLEDLLPVLERVAAELPFRLVIVGAGKPAPTLAGVPVVSRPWRLETEIADFQSFDVGLYPLRSDEWASGKSGLKAIQYMAVGTAYVASPVGVLADLAVPGATHLLARDADEWHRHLVTLLADGDLRSRMGKQGRAYVERNYTLRVGAERLAGAIRSAADA